MEKNIGKMRKTIKKLYYSFLFGGKYFVWLRVMHKFFDDRRAMLYLYEKCRQAYPEEYENILGLLYGIYTGEKLDLKNPKTFNEKIQWLKLYDAIRLKTVLADKYSVRDWVGKKIGEQYLIPLLGVWEKFEDIDFAGLPEQFVLKCTHGSGWNVIVNDKSKMEMSEIENDFKQWMNQNFAFVNGMELQYKNIFPRIVAEKYLENSEGNLYDYKFFVFHGRVKMIQVDMDRFTNHCRNLYTPEWKLINGMIQYPSNPKVNIPRPDDLDKLIQIAEILGRDFIHVRVDLYICNGDIYFGEMTFTHGSGIENFLPEELAVQMGSWMQLPEVDKERERYMLL